MPWVKGRSGNPRGRPSQRGPFAPLIRQALTRRAGPADPTTAEQIVRALIDAASAGDVTAMRFLIERVDGPAPRQVTLAGDGGGPIASAITLAWPEGERDAESPPCAPDSLSAG